MIWSIDKSEPKWPVAHLYRLCADMVENQPEVLYAHSSADVILVSGRLDLEEHIARSIAVVENKKTEHQLVVAVMVAGSRPTTALWPPPALQCAFDAIFIANEDEADEVARRLVRALITPGSAFQPSCCDWNDVRYIVGGQKHNSRPRFGSGRATGPDFARRAAHAALEKMGNQRPVNDGACALLAVTMPKGARASWYKESVSVIRNFMGANSSFAVGMVIDETLSTRYHRSRFFSIWRSTSRVASATLH